MTSDPTIGSAKSRPRKRSKANGQEASTIIQNSVDEIFSALAPYKKDSSGDQGREPYQPDVSKLFQLHEQLSQVQQLLTHMINTSNNQELNGSASSINSMKDGPVRMIPKLPSIPYEYNIMSELFRLRFLSEEDAKQRYDYFISEMLVFWPCISLPDNYSFDFLLENQPLTLLAFISVTCLNTPDLHDTLLYYLERNLAQRVSITGDLTVNLIQTYVVLSLWSSPPRKWGSYKHQMNLLIALDLSLCLDLGNDKFRKGPKVLNGNSEERKVVRAFMSIYSCCGSLGLSLPRFRVVSWTQNHESCFKVLLSGDCSRNDRFIAYYAKLISIGQEIFDFLSPDGSRIATDTTIPNRGEEPIFGSIEQSWNESLPQESLRMIMITFEQKMQKCASESELFKDQSSEKNLLHIIYYQILMTMYDFVVCRVLSKRENLSDIYLQTISRLIRASERLIDSFINLCEQTINFPTFFYYRPMHALVALIRARLLVRSQNLDVDLNVEREYERVSQALSNLSKKSLVAKKMSAILGRIKKWMKVSSQFTRDGANNSMVTLLDELGSEKAIEDLKTPSYRTIKVAKVSEPIKASSHHGDDTELKDSAKAIFGTKFVNCNNDQNVVGSAPVTRKDSIPMTSGEPSKGAGSHQLIPSLYSDHLSSSDPYRPSLNHRDSNAELNELFNQINSDVMCFLPPGLNFNIPDGVSQIGENEGVETPLGRNTVDNDDNVTSPMMDEMFGNIDFQNSW